MIRENFVVQAGMGEIIEHHAESVELAGALETDAGYYGACWVEVDEEGYRSDRDIPSALSNFVREVAQIVIENPAVRNIGRVGCAYMRVIDASRPENYMRWHTDNPDGGVRFHTAISSDGARVNLAWPQNDSMVGRRVTDTEWRNAYQPDNGVIVGFTTQAHGVLPQPPRQGQLTAVFFATLYPDRQSADLYTTNNTVTTGHAALPGLETSR